MDWQTNEMELELIKKILNRLKTGSFEKIENTERKTFCPNCECASF